jgi:hypothetical protein
LNSSTASPSDFHYLTNVLRIAVGHAQHIREVVEVFFRGLEGLPGGEGVFDEKALHPVICTHGRPLR